MSATLTIRDESATGQLLRSFLLELPTDVTTVRELIRARVEQEVSAYNARPPEAPFNGLVQPVGAEVVLNGSKPRRAIDAKEQADRAVEAFARHQFFLLLDDRQVDDLDELIVVRDVSKISFVKLVPLVGG